MRKLRVYSEHYLEFCSFVNRRKIGIESLREIRRCVKIGNIKSRRLNFAGCTITATRKERITSAFS